MNLIAFLISGFIVDEQDMQQQEEIIALAKEILDDAELSRVSAEALVLKASRLARLVKNESMLKWLQMERMGYADQALDLTYMAATGRTFDEVTRKGMWGSISVQEAGIEATLAEMEVVKNFKPEGQFAGMHLVNQQTQIRNLANNVATYKKIKSRVVAMIQAFATNVYYEKLFSQRAGDIFSQFSGSIDALLAEHTGEVLSMLPSVFERLQSNDREAVNQALLSCRRVLDAFINKLYPPRPESIDIDGQSIVVDKEKTRNRYLAYIAERTKSKSVRDKLIDSIRMLYDRTSAAVHDEVEKEEARALILQLYVTLGEILSLGNIPSPIVVAENSQQALEGINTAITAAQAT